MNPFLIFPEEIWELILGHLESSKDILAVVRAFPELNRLVTKNGYLWLFDQALPELYRWLPKKEFFFCRQVCKRWSRVADTFLEETNPDPQPTGYLWVTPPDRPTYDEKQYFKGILLQGSNSIGKVMKDMEGLHGGKNPFPGRSIFVNLRRTRKETYKEFYRRFGAHIWFIELGCKPSDQAGSRLRFFKSLMATLADLPNLRRLRLTWEGSSGEDPSSESDVTLEGFCCDRGEEMRRLNEPLREFPPLPPLPYLTTLEILECFQLPYPLVNKLLADYSPQLERILLQAEYWNGEVTSFPSLTQFCIFDLNENDMIADILRKLEAPRLFCIQTGEYGRFNSQTYLNMDIEFLPWLKRFPNLALLHIIYPFWSLELNSGYPCDLSDADVFPKVKSLIIMDHHLRLNYDFLLRFPSLEELQILTAPHSFTTDCSKDSSVKMRESMERNNMYDCNVWELLPKLQELTVELENAEEETVKFSGNRDIYKSLKLGK